MADTLMPNLFVVGAAKAGTTSLWHILKQHPDIFIPPDDYMKEPCFFTRLTGVDDAAQYFALFQDGAGRKYRAEVCTAYLSDPDVAAALHEFNPQAKIVIILRNPVHRAYSLYNWMVQQGLEYCGSFERALQLEQVRKSRRIPNFWQPMYYYDYMYRSTGEYFPQVSRFVELFGSSNVFIALFEDFVSNQQLFLQRLCSFLAIRSDFAHDAEARNRSVYVRFPALAFALRKFAVLAVQIGQALRLLACRRRLTPEQIDSFCNQLVQYAWSDGRPPDVSRETLRPLCDYYAKDRFALEEAFNLDLKAWYGESMDSATSSEETSGHASR